MPGSSLPAPLADRLSALDGPVVFLTGAGVSAESGVPTFRGEGGYWTVGSTVYRPTELATARFFRRDPWSVWQWYLYRRGVCHVARPNAGHAALVALERARPGALHLITQNIDGLHRRAGSDPDRTYEVHGSGDEMRCAARCTTARFPIPAGVTAKGPQQPVTEADKALLACPRCGGLARPHVLWFDEYYEEVFYRSDTAMAAAATAALFVTVGTSGATSLPLHAAAAAAEAGAIMVDVNPEPSPFSRFAEGSAHGAWLRGAASALLPALARVLGAPAPGPG